MIFFVPKIIDIWPQLLNSRQNVMEIQFLRHRVQAQVIHVQTNN